jgi:calcium release-activated calcium channel protein 1
MVEVHLAEDIPQSLLVIFTICTTLVVTIHLIALFISTCILPHIDAVAENRDESFWPRPDDNQLNVERSPHVRLHRYVELSWILSTGVGILLFLAQMAVVGWVRFYKISQTAAIVSTVVIIPAIVIFVLFAIHFYRHLVAYKFATATQKLQQLEDEVNRLEVERHHQSMSDIA